MRLSILFLVPASCVASRVSSFAGSTSTAVFPPPAAGTASPNDPDFPDASHVGNAGATPTGDEANVIATARVAPKVKTYGPLVKPRPLNKGEGSFDVLQHLGNLSPFRSVDSFGLPGSDELIPDGCKLNQVHLLHRHGARYPNGQGEGTPAAFASTLHAAASSGKLKVSSRLRFLQDWTFKLGADGLTPFGRQEMLDLGVAFRVKYGELLKGFDKLPVFRTTSQARMVDSALNFAVGFFGVQNYLQDYHQLIMIEASGFNNTLAPGAVCPNANNAIGNFGRVQNAKWANVYLQPALKRLSQSIQGLDLTISDLVGMQMTCAYETVALGYSSFCRIFNEKEWEGFAYWNDLLFWYSFGPGNPSVAAQGVGYVQELLSRLSRTPISTFNSSINSTLANDITFPLDQPMYVDATHDSVMTAIFTTMNFTSFSRNGPLPVDRIPKDQTYFVQQLAPFASNLVSQVLSCDTNSAESTHVRWILNDAVVPLTGIQGCRANKDGLCPLPAFISGLQQRLAEIDYEFDCFANYTIPDPDLITDGRFPPALRKNV